MQNQSNYLTLKAICGLCLSILTFGNAFAEPKNPTPITREIVPFHEGNGNGHIQELNTNYGLYTICKNDIEGFKKMLSGSEFFLYPSLREDLNVSMIARATTGEMGFEFLTGEVPVDHSSDKITFLMLSDIDLNLRESFDIHVNGKPLLTFNSNER